MFESSEYPKSLSEDTFDLWLEEGRNHKIGFAYLLIIWDEFASQYQPVYVENREAINAYEKFGEAVGQEALVAVYDLYSESRISIR